MPGAGALKDRVTFQQRGLDANGDRLGAWEDGFSAAAGIVYLRGSEPVMQQRLQGVQPVVVTVWDESRVRVLTSDWRMVNSRNQAQVFDIKSAAPAREAGFVDILGQSTAPNG